MSLKKGDKAGDDDRISYMDEELQFILENFEPSPEFSEELISDYYYNRRIFFILILCQYFLQLYILSITWADRNIVFQHVSSLSRSLLLFIVFDDLPLRAGECQVLLLHRLYE